VTVQIMVYVVSMTFIVLQGGSDKSEDVARNCSSP
jgi:hypothetical protein